MRVNRSDAKRLEIIGGERDGGKGKPEEGKLSCEAMTRTIQAQLTHSLSETKVKNELQMKENVRRQFDRSEDISAQKRTGGETSLRNLTSSTIHPCAKTCSNT